MKAFVRKAGLFVAALIFGVTLTAATGLPRPAPARCGAGVTSHIWSELDSRQTSDTVGGKTTSTQDVSHRYEINSDNGVDSTHLDTHRTNADGSSHGHQEHHVSDQGIGGKDCYPEMDGKPWKADSSTDNDKDAKGNRKEHHEELIDKNGKCTKYVRDSEWDSKGNLIKKTESRTEIPCGKWILEVFSKAFIDVVHSTVTWGPNTAKVYLESKGDGSYVGSYEGVFDAEMTGECEIFGTFPVSYDVTASKEDEFGDLDFSVKESMSGSATGVCWGRSGSDTEPTKTNTYTFKLPAEDGASHTESIVPGVTLTFTLKKR